MNYTRHHIACKGYCGFCKQLRAEGVDPKKEKEKEQQKEVVFAWDEGSVLV